jgi:hypothetical protein
MHDQLLPLVTARSGAWRRSQALMPTAGASSRGGGAALEMDLVFDPQPPEHLILLVSLPSKV